LRTYLPHFSIRIGQKEFLLSSDPFSQLWEEKYPEENPENLLKVYEIIWEISDNSLFLIELYTKFEKGQVETIETFFPNAGSKILADWFTGKLKVHHGLMLTDRISSKELWIYIEKGKVIKEQLIGLWNDTNWKFND
jgi:hypothetical protein